MKKIKISYWIITILFALFMISTVVPDIMTPEEAVKFMDHLGYPKYLIPFLGIAKFLGSIAILIPSFKKIKEWAYAGLFFDLTGATYSNIRVDGFQPSLLFMILPFALGIASYMLNQKLFNKSPAKL